MAQLRLSASRKTSGRRLLIQAATSRAWIYLRFRPLPSNSWDVKSGAIQLALAGFGGLFAMFWLTGCANYKPQELHLGRSYYDYRYGGLVDPAPFGPDE